MTLKPVKNQKTMGRAKKVAQYDDQFQFYLNDRFGEKRAEKILRSPSNAKRVYKEYLDSDYAKQKDSIPF